MTVHYVADGNGALKFSTRKAANRYLDKQGFTGQGDSSQTLLQPGRPTLPRSPKAAK